MFRPSPTVGYQGYLTGIKAFFTGYHELSLLGMDTSNREVRCLEPRFVLIPLGLGMKGRVEHSTKSRECREIDSASRRC